MDRGRNHPNHTHSAQGHKRPRAHSAHGNSNSTSDAHRGRRHEGPSRGPPHGAAATITSSGPTHTSPSTGGSGSSVNTASKLFHPFRANFNDHFETSRSALEDVLPVVVELRQVLRPSTPDKFTLYDPYYCSGTVVTRWKDLGLQHVLHENRDFYEDIRQNTVPGPYDMLVTNPPFSDDHIIRMLNFLVLKQDKPWAFLAPDYIVAKPWYKEFVRRHFAPAPPTGKGDIKATRRVVPAPVTFALPPFLLAQEAAAAAAAAAAKDAPNSTELGVAPTTEETTTPQEPQTTSTAAPVPASSSAGADLPMEPFYLVPRSTYDFEHPTGAGNAHSHFKSMWYVWCGTSARRQQEVMRGAKVALAPRRVEVVHGLVALKESGLVTAMLK